MPKSAKKKSKSVKIKSKTKKENYTKYFLHYAYCLAVIVLLVITSLNLEKAISGNQKKVLGSSIDVTPLQNEKAYWQNIIYQNPSYVDGYLQLAKVDTQIGDKNEAIEYIKKALDLDPNSPKITSVQKALGL